MFGTKQRHNLRGNHRDLLNELQSEDITSYKNYLRMDEETKIAPLISQQNTHLTNVISAEVRVTVTLRFLATAES